MIEDNKECGTCGGSGEGMHEGSTCYKCGGSGTFYENEDY